MKFQKGNLHRFTPGNRIQSRMPDPIDVEEFERSIADLPKERLIGRAVAQEKVVNRIANHIAKTDAIRTPLLFAKLTRRLDNAADKLSLIQETIRRFDERRTEPVTTQQDRLLAAVERA